MNYFRCCDGYTDYIDNYSLSQQDIELMSEFLKEYKRFYGINNDGYFYSNNRANVVEAWSYFLEEKRPKTKPKTPPTYGSTIYRATFGEKYTLEQLINNPLYFSPGVNGSGMYAAIDDRYGSNYIKKHLQKQFTAFDNKIGNILKIDVRDDAKVMSKIDIHRAKIRFIEEISQKNMDENMKHTLSAFIDSDPSITGLLLGADMMYLPNGHVIVLNKDSLMFPETQEDIENHTLQVNLEKFRAKDEKEVQKVDEFLQPE